MELYLVRHAPAHPLGEGEEDEARPLTPEGRKKMIREVKGLGALGLKLDRVYHSPWLRALETAELLAPLLDGETVATPALAMAPGEELLELLSGERVALVGHEPWLGALCSWLVTGRAEGGEGFSFKKGGVAILGGDPEPGAMRLQAFLPPRVMRALAR